MWEHDPYKGKRILRTLGIFALFLIFLGLGIAISKGCTAEMVIVVLCVEIPSTLYVPGVFSLTERKVDDEVSLFTADEQRKFLAYGAITAVRHDTKWPSAWRYDVRVIGDGIMVE